MSLSKKTIKLLKRNVFEMLLITTLLISGFLLYTKKTEIYYVIGNVMFGRRVLQHSFYNIDIAEFFLTKANSKNSSIMWTNYQLSRINFIRGKFTNAIFFANEELRLYPENCRAYYIRGLAYGYQDKLDQAIYDFESFNKCFPDEWAGSNDLSWVYFRKGEMQKVITIIEKIKEQNQNNPWIQNTYGVALMNVKRYSDAKKAFISAKNRADAMTAEEWGNSYPGNDKSIYPKGLSALQASINKNLEILKKYE
jgi:tetratricopeptide (TPR) repeat protein